jgi:succinate dehydrogenase / fumarate reductase, cytochrome b subunit
LNTPTKHPRPLSPFLFSESGLLYRWQYTMALSILNRVTGVILSVGLLPLTYWLVAAASGPEAYADAQRFFSHLLTKIALVGFSFAFFFHLMNGVRHLVWDTGHGLERRSARISGWVAFLGSVVLTLFFWFLVLRSSGGAA